MPKFLIHKSEPLEGNVKIGGSKNSVLPILAASLLTEEKIVIKSVTPFKDVIVMIDILKNLGAEVEFDEKKETVIIKSVNLKKFEDDYSAHQMRASFLIMGPLLARFGKAKIPLPGGCPIGSRPVDLHLKGFLLLGAKIKQEYGYVEIKGKKLIGNSIYLDFPSVGATENIMMAACLAEGRTVIANSAAEPEICDLANFLNKMGAKIKGAGTDTITIDGVKKLNGTEHKVIPDRIEAGTFMIAAAITKGDVMIENVNIEHLKPVVAKLDEMNIKNEIFKNKIRVYYDGGRMQSTNLKTLPYPGFPTDMQAPFMSLLAMADGASIVTETIFENRFMHAGELKRMGANITIESQTAVIEGVKKLTGTQVKATDLRAGAALILSALAAEGDTEISDIYHIERGYYNIEKKLKSLGASIEKTKNDDPN